MRCRKTSLSLFPREPTQYLQSRSLDWSSWRHCQNIYHGRSKSNRTIDILYRSDKVVTIEPFARLFFEWKILYVCERKLKMSIYRYLLLEGFLFWSLLFEFFNIKDYTFVIHEIQYVMNLMNVWIHYVKARLEISLPLTSLILQSTEEHLQVFYSFYIVLGCSIGHFHLVRNVLSVCRSFSVYCPSDALETRWLGEKIGGKYCCYCSLWGWYWWICFL